MRIYHPSALRTDAAREFVENIISVFFGGGWLGTSAVKYTHLIHVSAAASLHHAIVVTRCICPTCRVRSDNARKLMSSKNTGEKCSGAGYLLKNIEATRLLDEADERLCA